MCSSIRTIRRRGGSIFGWLSRRKGEWDVDVVVVNGTVEYVDIRVQPSLLVEFVECLFEDVNDERAATILRNIATRQDLVLDVDPDEM
jgi:hypothetical protein